MIYQYAFIVLFNSIVGAQTPLQRSPMKIGPFAGVCSNDSRKLCEEQRDLLLSNNADPKFPHVRLVVDCFPTDPK